jgi:hypothetical protein
MSNVPAIHLFHHAEEMELGFDCGLHR